MNSWSPDAGDRDGQIGERAIARSVANLFRSRNVQVLGAGVGDKPQVE